MNNETLAFIGGGNMAASLIGGLIADGHDPGQVLVSDPDAQKLTALRNRYGVRIADNNPDALRHGNVTVLCVKPQLAQGVCRELALAAQERKPLMISVMAGIRERSLQAWLGGGIALVRAMPNTPALIQSGATGLHASPEVSPEQRDQAESILRAVGLTCWVDAEPLMDVVTALSGSGPAYCFLIMEAMEQAAAEMGLDPPSARLLTIQTVLGAARMAIESDEPPTTLRERVTSPGGTTERALTTLTEGGLQDLIGRALLAARDRSVELSELLAGDQ